MKCSKCRGLGFIEKLMVPKYRSVGHSDNIMRLDNRCVDVPGAVIQGMKIIKFPCRKCAGSGQLADPPEAVFFRPPLPSET